MCVFLSMGFMPEINLCNAMLYLSSFSFQSHCFTALHFTVFDSDVVQI